MSSDEEDGRVSEEEGEEEDEDVPKKKKALTKRRETGQDDEASEEDDDDDEEEEDEDAPNEYEKDDFLVDEVEEEDEGGGEEEDDEEERKRKKRRKREELELDEDDYDLIAEANPDFRPPIKKGSKFKRLKKAGGVGGDGGTDEARRARTQEELQQELFGEDEGPDEEPEEERQQDFEEEEEDFDDNEMGDFIVDDEFDAEGNLVPRRKVKKNKGAERRGVVGASSVALQDAQDIFGGVDELLEQYRNREGGERVDEDFEDLHVDEDDMDEDEGEPRQRRKVSKAMKAAQRAFEPSLLEERFMTDRDDRIRATDVPERFQILEEQLGPMPGPEESAREAEWIYAHVFHVDLAPRRSEFFELSKPEIMADVEAEIADVLTLMHDEKLEVPYIGMYRREKCHLLLSRICPRLEKPGEPEPKPEDKEDEEKSKLQRFEALWAIYEADQKWMALNLRKRKLLGAYRALIEGAPKQSDEEAKQWRSVLFEIEGLLKDATSEHAVADVEARVRLMLPVEDVSQQTSKQKRPERNSLYDYCVKSGFGQVAAKFGLSAKQLGENLQKGFQDHDVEDYPSAPEELAAELIAPEFGGPAQVLKGARHIAAVEIGAEPSIRAFVREKYLPTTDEDAKEDDEKRRGAVVNTKPTAKGLEVITDLHQYKPVEWIYNKPINKVKDAEWLLVTKAVDEGLLEVIVGMQEWALAELKGILEENYVSAAVSKVAKTWNEQRKDVIEEALYKYLIPVVQAEARALLSERARSFVTGECERSLWKMAARAPFARKKGPENADDDEHACRVMAVCWGPGRPATTVVMLDDRGDLIDTLYAGFLGNKGAGALGKERWEEDKRKLEGFIKEHKPHMAVVGAANLRCKNLFEDVNQVVYSIVEHDMRSLADGIDTIQVVYGDESAPLLYEKSKVSESELPGQPEMVRRAVALGRGIQNPLASLAALCGPGREIALLRMHNLQGLVPKDELWSAVERVMCTITTQVGIDVNTAIHHEWLFSPLQFVPGLGPRKAQAVQQALVGRGRLTLRKDLLNFNLLTRRVFINAAGSLRTRSTGAAAHAEDMDFLDDTRIHPLKYNLASALAKAAWLAEKKITEDEADPDDLEMAVQEVAERPSMIKKVDLDRFAREHEAEHEDIRAHLKLIKDELLEPYAEWRPPYRQPDNDERFTLLTGETDETLRKDQIVQVTVRRKLTDKVICALESGLTGIVYESELTDHGKAAAEEIFSQLKEGQVLTAGVTEIQKGAFLVKLSCRGSYLNGRHFQMQKDPDDPDGKYYHVSAKVLETIDAAKKKKEAKRQYRPRMIQHPLFKNCNTLEATQLLASKEIGDVLIRPSSKGPTHLTLSVKFYHNVFAHFDIEEGGKDKGDPTSFLKLGSSLKIGEETYEDLDEVMARYIDPFMDYLRKILGYRKFKEGTKLEIDNALRREKAQNLQRVAYAISVDFDHAGALILSYIRSQNVHHEYITVSSRGYRFRHQYFTSPDRLVQYFQKHINDPVMPPAPPRRAAAAHVPLPSQQGGPEQSQPRGGRWDQQAQPAQHDYHNGHGNWPSQPYGGDNQWGSGWGPADPPQPPAAPPAPPPPPGPPPPGTHPEANAWGPATGWDSQGNGHGQHAPYQAGR